MGTYLVTGGAGFIGSNMVAGLSQRHPNARIVICDILGNGNKWKNITKHPVDEVIPPSELFYWLEMHSHELEAIFHMGAISSTIETDADLINEMNFSLPRMLHSWCTENQKRLIYASSGSTYGDGARGFDDDMTLDYLSSLRPLNPYGWSKYQFDYYVARSIARSEPQPAQCVGLKFFNVYGPNEYHKEDQQSVVSKIFPHAQAKRPVSLFKSYHDDYDDGGQMRDFVYVKDCVSVMLWLLDNPDVSGLFNVGSGQARSFSDLAAAVFTALGHETQITYVDMPEALKAKYQYFTEAKIERLRNAGYTQPFHSLEGGIADYVQNYLNTDDLYL